MQSLVGRGGPQTLVFLTSSQVMPMAQTTLWAERIRTVVSQLSCALESPGDLLKTGHILDQLNHSLWQCDTANTILETSHVIPREQPNLGLLI